MTDENIIVFVTVRYVRYLRVLLNRNDPFLEGVERVEVAPHAQEEYIRVYIPVFHLNNRDILYIKIKYKRPPLLRYRVVYGIYSY